MNLWTPFLFFFKLFHGDSYQAVDTILFVNKISFAPVPIVQVPTLFDKQGAQLAAVAFLVLSRTWISDRIASLNGTCSYFVSFRMTFGEGSVS